MRGYGKIARGGLKAALLGSAAVAVIATSAMAQDQRPISFDIAAQDVGSALNDFSRQSGMRVLFPYDSVEGKRAKALRGDMTADEALHALLQGTGLVVAANDGAMVTLTDPQSESAAGDGADGGTVEALIVTAQKREEDIQDVPIAISAFTQEALERSQIAGGPDLMTQVPNMTFTKTNFSSYSIQIRGIGTQAISATTDPAVAVAFNNTPFVRNRFFEQEFYDLQRVEVLRGPQGTLYGRNATAGVVNIISQKPKLDVYEAKVAADIANYSSSRLEGMINLPLVEGKVALRVASAWTKREGYVTNILEGEQTDGRDLWSTRLSLRFAPTDAVEANLIWEHFEEDDDRLRSGKQLCHRDDRTEIEGHPIYFWDAYYYQPFSQGCLPASLYGPESFEAPFGPSLPYKFGDANGLVDPYASTTQSRNLREIETLVEPRYQAKNDIFELQLSFDINESLSLNSETAYSADEIFSLEDYNRFAPARGTFVFNNARPNLVQPNPYGWEFCDPQLGCADYIMAADLSKAQSRQFSQEFRLSSDYVGPVNFSVGTNFLRYDTMEKYYVFINTLTMRAASYWPGLADSIPPWPFSDGDDRGCLQRGMEPPDFNKVHEVLGCTYIDPNPIESLNDMGHNYFLSKNPYKLISYAAFGELYYNIAGNLKLTAGLRWTVDRKEAPRIPSWVLGADSAGSTVIGVERQQWREPTGRLTLDWKPDLGFTDETLLYASFSRGYKAGGANPPPTGLVLYNPGAGCGCTADGQLANWAGHPLTFRPEFVNAAEVGAKNTLMDGALTLNAGAFYYDYKDYQISQIIDRSAVNYNFDAEVWGLELEADWRPLENFRLGFRGGFEDTRIADGMKAVDVMDRTAGREGWMVVKPFPSFPSNCILPLYTLVQYDDYIRMPPAIFQGGDVGVCEYAYAVHVDPFTQLPYEPFPERNNYHIPNYPGFDPLAGTPGHPYTGQNTFNGVDYGPAPNNGAGFDKDLSGNELPNAPHFTASVTADYTVPLPQDWLMTLHTDLYYQSEAWTRVFNTEGYDKLKAYTNVNVAAIFTNEDAGWKVMAYVKNVFDKDNITGAFLNSDDTGLTTNVFLSEPRLYGLRVTKEWNGGPWWTGADPSHVGPYPLILEIGGQVQRHEAPYSTIAADFVDVFSDAIRPTSSQHGDFDWGDGREVALIYRSRTASHFIKGAYRFGRANTATTFAHLSEEGDQGCIFFQKYGSPCPPPGETNKYTVTVTNWSDNSARTEEKHELVDFEVGRDFGLGSLGLSRSEVSAGIRYAGFHSKTAVLMEGVPEWDLPDYGVWKYEAPRHRYTAELTASRDFEGLGPTLTWSATKPLLGGDDIGHLGLDWSIRGSVLFGKQSNTIEGSRNDGELDGKYYGYPDWIDTPATPVSASRKTDVTVPVVELGLGLSYDIGRIKLGAGYRWERYFDVLDVGYDEHQDGDRTFEGPYFKIAVGFGG